MLKSFSIPMFSYLRVSHANGVQMQGGVLQQSTRATAACAASAQPPAISARHAEPSQLELPREIWGEIASFSTRHDVLNLRATSTTLRHQADTTIKTLTIFDSAALRMFAESQGFESLQLLRIDFTDHASMMHLAHALVMRPRDRLVLEMMHGYANIRSVLARLHAVPMAALVLKSPNLERDVVSALRQFISPVSLIGHFVAKDFEAISLIPALTHLSVLSSRFDEEAAGHLATHSALKSLTLSVTSNITPRCLTLLAAIASLRTWRLDESVYALWPISSDVAAAIAANPSLENLVIKTPIQPLSRKSVHALSKSTTLKRLDMTVCAGMGCLANLTALEHLLLNGRSQNSPAISVSTARHFASLGKLRSLSILGARFAPDALRTLLTVCRVPRLYLNDVGLTDAHLDALLNNVSLKDLTLIAATLKLTHIAALLAHPTLTRLRVGSAHYHLNAPMTDIASYEFAPH